MYSFEGQFRKKPTQSLGGASKKEEKSLLIQRTHEDRKRREEQRLRQDNALIIQAFYRSYKTRLKASHLERDLFDQEFTRLKRSNGDVDIATLTSLIRQLLFFYKARLDHHRLIWLCQVMIKQNNAIARWICERNTMGFHQLKKVLHLDCCYLMDISADSASIAVPLRMLEIYCALSLYAPLSSQTQAERIVSSVLYHLIQKGYFKCIQRLLTHRVPDSIEDCSQPPTPLAASLLHLIQLPLQMVSKYSETNQRGDVLRSLCHELFCLPHTSQVREFILPALSASTSKFPVSQFIEALQSRPAQSSKELKSSLWLLLAFLKLTLPHLSQLTSTGLQSYISVLQRLVGHLKVADSTVSDCGSDSEDEPMEYSLQNDSDSWAYRSCVDLLDTTDQVKAVVACVRTGDHDSITALCSICHHLLSHCHSSIHKTRLLYSLAFNPGFIKKLWHVCSGITTTSVTGARTSLLQMLSRGLHLSDEDSGRIIPLVSVFCSLFSHSLMSLHDAEFYGEHAGTHSFMPFTVKELVPMTRVLCDVCLGIIELAHPDTKPVLKTDYSEALRSIGVAQQKKQGSDELKKQRKTWAYLFKVVAQLVKQMYDRDGRRNFCPPGHWLASHLNIYANTPSQLYHNPNPVFVRRPFGTLSALNPDRILEEEGPPLSTTEVRKLTVLTELPFVVPFAERVKIFHKLVHQDRIQHQGEHAHYTGGPQINILIRRNYLYEDAFERLSPDNEPNLRLRMTVQLKNFAGLNEAGIDGGGLFREFMSLLLKTGFDPNRGFFQCTMDELIYPNPQARLLVDNYQQHYYFMGRMLGKALYENMLVELPFASFFLSKILSLGRGDVDIHHLASLDPEMYKNLIFLKNYEGDVSELDLDFTVVNSELGETKVEELKPGGRDIPVTNFNRIEYIHLMADYRLNRQIRRHCTAFQQGLADVISLDWLRMFDHNELQVLISGAEVPIDIEDLKRHSNYSGGYTAEHQIIKWFWEAVDEFSDSEKSALLKFVTSCSRPPLLGFKELYPAFCIHYAGKEEDRLPTASTCMNLLKLPEFPDYQTLKEKLHYAITSGAGFELS